jgi:hypothetical protein
MPSTDAELMPSSRCRADAIEPIRADAQLMPFCLYILAVFRNVIWTQTMSIWFSLQHAHNALTASTAKVRKRFTLKVHALRARDRKTAKRCNKISRVWNRKENEAKLICEISGWKRWGGGLPVLCYTDIHPTRMNKQQLPHPHPHLRSQSR